MIRRPAPRLLRTSAAVTAVVAVGLGVSACEVKPGAAAFVGDTRITESQVSGYLSDTPATEPTQPGQLSTRQQVLSTLVTTQLFRDYLQRSGGVPSDSALAGERSEAFQVVTGQAITDLDQLRSALAGFGFDGSFADLYARQIGYEYVVIRNTKAANLASLAKEVGGAVPAPRISPRYGTWNAAQLALTGGTATPSYLQLSTTSAPAPA